MHQRIKKRFIFQNWANFSLYFCGTFNFQRYKKRYSICSHVWISVFELLWNQTPISEGGRREVSPLLQWRSYLSSVDCFSSLSSLSPPIKSKTCFSLRSALLHYAPDLCILFCSCLSQLLIFYSVIWIVLCVAYVWSIKTWFFLVSCLLVHC